MTNDEICSIVISLCHLNLEFFNLLDDCLNQLRKNFEELTTLNLVQLLVAGKYYINYSKHSGKIFTKFLLFLYFIYYLLIFFRFLLSSS